MRLKSVGTIVYYLVSIISIKLTHSANVLNKSDKLLHSRIPIYALREIVKSGQLNTPPLFIFMFGTSYNNLHRVVQVETKPSKGDWLTI